MKSYDRCFITGCDKRTEWMLKWFLHNYKQHNDTPIVFADFGVSSEMKHWVYRISEFDDMFQVPKQKNNGWFLKPKTFLMSPGKETCWLDTDIHVLGDLSGIFDYLEPNRIAMVEDKPWSLRSGEKWHNSGVVAFRDKPIVLQQWYNRCRTHPRQGDQEVLHDLVSLSPLLRMQHITDLPNIYNWLRVQLLDGQDSPNKLAMHWTGEKGKRQIEKLMYNSPKHLRLR